MTDDIPLRKFMRTNGLHFVKPNLPPDLAELYLRKHFAILSQHGWARLSPTYRASLITAIVTCEFGRAQETKILIAFRTRDEVLQFTASL